MRSEVRQLEEMREAAYGLGLGFAQAAQAEGDLDRKLLLFDAFQRGFASVRLSIALAMRLRSEARRPAPTERDHETERPEALARPDHPERPERYDERDRDREAERASLPLLLRTLTSVADDARALTPQAAELITLDELLDRVRAQPATPPSPSPHPSRPSSSALRARLAGGTAALTLSPPPREPLPGLPGAAPRRSTGPP